MVNPQHIVRAVRLDRDDDAASVFLQPALRASQNQVSRLNDARLVPQQRRRATNLAEGQFTAESTQASSRTRLMWICNSAPTGNASMLSAKSPNSNVRSLLTAADTRMHSCRR